jgi:ribonuclease D
MKVGVGLANDISVIWSDLRSEVKNMVDVGLMAKLLLAEKYCNTGYSNVGMQDCVADVLGYQLDKGPQKSNWKAELSDDQIKCECQKGKKNHTLD